jgi:hypothetical protein
MNTQDDERISMQFVMISAVQDPDAEHKEKLGGAHVCCWIKDQSPRNAAYIAKGWIEDAGWIVQDIDEHYPVTADDFADKPESAQYYEQALTDGEAFVYHVFPPES